MILSVTFDEIREDYLNDSRDISRAHTCVVARYLFTYFKRELIRVDLKHTLAVGYIR